MPGEMSFLKTSHLVFGGDESSRQKSISGEVKDGRLPSAVGVTSFYIYIYISVGICVLLESRG